jgi:hypothetical protein
MTFQPLKSTCNIQISTYLKNIFINSFCWFYTIYTIDNNPSGALLYLIVPWQ